MKAFVCVVFVLAVSSGMAQQQSDPCSVKSKIVSDVNYCDRYWECVDGKAETFDCPNGLIFAGAKRGLLENCDYPWRGDSCEGKTLANPPLTVGPCDYHYGIFGHEDSCIRYWSCWNGTASEMKCPGGLLYSEELHACDYPENVEGCQKHPLCVDDSNGNVPLGKSCTRYFSCIGGFPRLQRCPATLVFDRRALRCVIPPTEDCEAPPPPPPPSSSEEEDKTNSDKDRQPIFNEEEEENFEQ